MICKVKRFQAEHRSHATSALTITIPSLTPRIHSRRKLDDLAVCLPHWSPSCTQDAMLQSVAYRDSESSLLPLTPVLQTIDARSTRRNPELCNFQMPRILIHFLLPLLLTGLTASVTRTPDLDRSMLILGALPRFPASQDCMRFCNSGSDSSPINVQLSSISPVPSSPNGFDVALFDAFRALISVLAYSRSR